MARMAASGRVLWRIREQGVPVPFTAGPPPPFHHGVSALHDTTDAGWWTEESSRLVRVGALEPGMTSRYVSIVFLGPKPGSNNSRVVIDLRHLNLYCAFYNMRFETLRRLRHLACRGDWAFSFDMHGGYYALGLRKDIRDYFTINVRGTLWRFAAPPVGWSLNPMGLYYFCTFVGVMVRYLRQPDFARPMRGPAAPRCAACVVAKRAGLRA
eukprot:jgi/Tetstr1/443357/TSEL_031372.t1